MVRSIPFPLMPLSPGGEVPHWDGEGFCVGDEHLSVLAYDVGVSGWADEFTASLEDMHAGRHFMEVASRRQALAALRRWLPSGGKTILEVGSSSGYMIADLCADRPDDIVIGSDYVLEPLQNLARRQPGVPLLRFDLTCAPLPDGSLDALIALNVLEHIEDDRKAVGEIHRMLKPGGIVLIELPAGGKLYDFYDAAWMHHRRYDLPQVTSLLRDAGLEIVHANHMGCALYPAFAWTKRRNQRLSLAAGQERLQRALAANHASAALNIPMGWLMAAEAWLGRFISYPFGIRNFTVARRPG